GKDILQALAFRQYRLRRASAADEVHEVLKRLVSADEHLGYAVSYRNGGNSEVLHCLHKIRAGERLDQIIEGRQRRSGDLVDHASNARLKAGNAVVEFLGCLACAGAERVAEAVTF